MFLATWQRLEMPNDDVWINNILLVKIFLEAIRLAELTDPKKSREPIEPWKSAKEKEGFLKTVEDFMRKARKKSNEEK